MEIKKAYLKDVRPNLLKELEKEFQKIKKN